MNTGHYVYLTDFLSGITKYLLEFVLVVRLASPPAMAKDKKVNWEELGRQPYDFQERVLSPLGVGVVTGMTQSLAGWRIMVTLEKEVETEDGRKVKHWRGPAIGLSQIPAAERKRKPKQP